MMDDPTAARLERVRLQTDRTLRRVLDGGVFSGLVATSGKPSANRAGADATDAGDIDPGPRAPESVAGDTGSGPGVAAKGERQADSLEAQPEASPRHEPVDRVQSGLPVRRPGSADHAVLALGSSSPSEATLTVNVNLMGGTIFLDDERRTRALAKEIKRLITEDKRRGLTV